MSYTMMQVENAERQIRAACPDAHVRRSNYDRTLVAVRADETEAFLVFDDRDGHPIVIGDVAAIIAALGAG